MSLPAYALTTLTRVKNRAGIPDATTDFDTILERLITIATNLIESNCQGRRFLTGTHTSEVHDAEPGQTVFYLNHWPVTSLTTVQFNAGTPGTPSWSTELADNYALRENGDLGRVRMYSGYVGINALRFTYVAGYKIDWTHETDESLHNLPFEISDLCERLALAKFNKRTDEGKASQASQDNSITWDKMTLSESDLDLLRPYQRPRLA